ncbi:MAG: BTAD domain-containing putative transcriptional regulator [Rubrivivax sp.]
MTTDPVDAWMAELLVDDARVRAPLQQAWARAEGDEALRARLAALALLAMHVEYADFRGLDDWLARLRPDLPAARPIDGLRADAALLVRPSLDHRFEHDAADVKAAAARLFQALVDGSCGDGDERVLLAKALYDHASLEDDAARCERVAALMVSHLRSGAVSATWQARWWLMLETALDYWGPPEAAAQAREQARAQLARGAGESCALGFTLAQLRQAQAAQDAPGIDRAMAEIDRLRPLMRPGLALRGLHAQAAVLVRRGAHHAALEREDRVLGLCDDAGVPERDRGVYREQRAYALAGLRRWDEALAELDRMRPHQKAVQAQMVDAIHLALAAAAALDQGRPDAREHALQAVRAAAALGWRRFLSVFPTWAAQVAAIGLQDGCEADFLRQAIRERRLAPPEPGREDWPWRLRVRVLGELRIERDGEPLVMTGKVPRKPLDLLVLLAAHAGGLDPATLIDTLWPSLEANAPRASLEMAVSRLRKLLDLPDAVQVADGRVALNPALVWTDARAFVALDDAAQAGDADAAERARALYRGPLVAGADDAEQQLGPVRARLAARHARLVQDEAGRLRAAGDGAAAVRLLERALQHEPLAEPLHRALIAAQLQAGERAEALRSYRRCAELLQRVLGVAPAEETQALARQARDGA